jgi:uncharacterized protein (DUF2336 family)
MSAPLSLMNDLEAAVQRGSREKRVNALRRITDLFLVAPARLNDAQIHLFDDVLTHLITRVEVKARTELARRLAPIEQAPAEMVRNLAHDDEIAVAGPVLTESRRLTTHDLVGIAQHKGQTHLEVRRQSCSEHDTVAAAAEFKKLTAQTAARVLRFWQVRQIVGPDAGAIDRSGLPDLRTRGGERDETG